LSAILYSAVFQSQSIHTFTVPSKAPDGLSLETYNRSVTVKWEAIHLPHFYGGILGYKVFIHQANAHQGNIACTSKI